MTNNPSPGTVFFWLFVYLVIWSYEPKRVWYWHKIGFAWAVITALYAVGLPWFIVKQYYLMLKKYKRLFDNDVNK